MLRSMGSQRVGHHLAPEQQQQCMMMGRSFQTWVLVWMVPEQLRAQAVYLQCNMLSRPFSCQPSLPHGTCLSGALASALGLFTLISRCGPGGPESQSLGVSGPGLQPSLILLCALSFLFGKNPD